MSETPNSPAPEPTGAGDFDAATGATSKVVEIAGRQVQLPDKLPPGAAAAVRMKRDDLIYRMLAGDDPELLDFLIVNLTEEDWETKIGPAYGFRKGESAASAG